MRRREPEKRRQMTSNRKRIEELRRTRTLPRADLRELLTSLSREDEVFLYANAYGVCTENYGDDVYIRGLIEISNYCRNDCYYCGIRKSNQNAERYRLSAEQILACAAQGWTLGFRTFVLQGGEDPFFSDEKLVPIVEKLRGEYPECAITLSLGERGRESYQRLFCAGADRYLLRHETIDPAHYRLLHPEELTIERRRQCLEDLRDIGFQTGCGIMVGSPGQTVENILDDLAFMADFRPHMVGIGPFLPHSDTPFAEEPPGSVSDTRHLLAILRLLMPGVLLPATTALGTAETGGRELGILAGANVVMPNLSPVEVRQKYSLYNGKLRDGAEAAEGLRELEERIKKTGRHIVTARGDSRISACAASPRNSR